MDSKYTASQQLFIYDHHCQSLKYVDGTFQPLKIRKIGKYGVQRPQSILAAQTNI